VVPDKESANEGQTQQESSQSETESPILRDFVSSLEQMHIKAMREIDEEITNFDEQIAKNEIQETALRELIDKIEAAVIYWDTEVNIEPVKHNYTWEADILKHRSEEYSVEEATAFFSNEYYELIKFRCKWLGDYDNDCWVLNTSIMIEERETRITGVPEVMLGDLLRRKSALTDDRTTIVEAKEQAVQVLSDMLEQRNAWDVEYVIEKVFSVSGYGLGYCEDGLCTGRWHYYSDEEAIEPQSSASTELQDILTAKT
jgi:hypothetical protein